MSQIKCFTIKDICSSLSVMVKKLLAIVISKMDHDHPVIFKMDRSFIFRNFFFVVNIVRAG